MDNAAIFKVKLDGTVVGRFGSAGELPKEFGLAKSIDSAARTGSRRRDRQLGCRS